MAQARGQLRELRRLLVTDMFAEDAGSARPLLRQLVRAMARGETLQDVVQVRAAGACLPRPPHASGPICHGSSCLPSWPPHVR